MKKIELFPAEPQVDWGWQVAANFIMVGAGTGFYLFSIIVTFLEARSFIFSGQVQYSLLAPVFATMGFLALTMKPGRPLRSMYLFNNLQKSWVSRETLLWSVFIPLAVLDWFIPHPVLRVLTIAAAVTLMISQGAILYQLRAITVWNVFAIPVFFISSGLASGGGVFLLTGGLTRSLVPFSAVITGITVLSVNLTVWLIYLYWYHSSDYNEAIERLRRPLNLGMTVGIGHILPLLLFVLMGWSYSGPERPVVAETVSGVAILLGAIIQKMAIVVRASKTKAIIIDALKN